MASSLWVGPVGGDAAQAIDGRTLSRPSWSLDDAIWVVVDGNNVVRVIQEAASGQPARIPVDSTAVSTRFPGPIAELQLSRDGTRAAMVIDGQVILAGVEQTQGGQYALTYPAAAGLRARRHRGVAVLAHRRRHRASAAPTPSIRCPTSTSTG